MYRNGRRVVTPEYEDEVAETWDVQRALVTLHHIDPIWFSNLATFERMNPRTRILWWRGARKQAQLGVPAMQTLLLKVIEIRLTE
jgi:hypothetical protein